MEMNSKLKNREVQRVKHDTKVRDVTVSGISPMGNNMVAITFKGESLVDFVSMSFDDHIKFIIPDGDGKQVRRDYTPINYNQNKLELTLEFVLHAEGAATEWVRKAKVGMSAIIAGPRNSMIIPSDYDWYLLIGDLSALPAIKRCLKELPSSSKVITIVEVEQLGEEGTLVTNAKVNSQWIPSGGEILDVVRALQLPQGTGYVWAAGEAAKMKKLREVLTQEKQHPKDSMRVSAYWKQGVSEFHERIE